MTRTPLALLAVLLLCPGLAACGDSGRGSAASAAPRHSDRDNDNDHNDDDGHVLGFGHAADAAELHSSVALVTSYFAAAAAADGAQACKLLVPMQAEAVIEADGGSQALRGRTCAVVMSKLFGRHHMELVEKAAALKVIAVRIEGDVGLAVLEFPEIHEVRQLGLRRVAGTWRVLDLLDGIIE